MRNIANGPTFRICHTSHTPLGDTSKTAFVQEIATVVVSSLCMVVLNPEGCAGAPPLASNLRAPSNHPSDILHRQVPGPITS
jgi:hypothetical protein